MKLFIGKFKTIDVAPLWMRIKKKDDIITVLNDEVINFLEELKKDQKKALLLETMKETKYVVMYYKSERYAPLKKGMYYVYLARPRKIVVGCSERKEGLKMEIRRLSSDYGCVNTCRLVEALF